MVLGVWQSSERIQIMRDLNKFKGCLIGGGVGDALRYAVEFLPSNISNGTLRMILLSHAISNLVS